MEDQFFAADAERITDVNATSEDCKRTSGGVFVAIDSDLGAVIDKGGGAVISIAQGRVNIRGGTRSLPCIFGIRKDGHRELGRWWKLGSMQDWKTPSEMKKKDEVRKLEEVQQRKVSRMIKSADDNAGSCTGSPCLRHGEECRI